MQMDWLWTADLHHFLLASEKDTAGYRIGFEMRASRVSESFAVF